jgi:hypothetical protein
MNNHFSQLSEQEYQDLKDALAKITVFIAGADGSIEAEETQWAAKVAEIRSYKSSEDLIEFYKDVNNEFDNKLSHLITNLPKSTPERNAIISEHLSALNPVLAKLDPKVGAHLYKGFVSFAEHVAKSTGGLFGFFSIGAEEKALLGLNMINPIIVEEPAEEEE